MNKTIIAFGMLTILAGCTESPEQHEKSVARQVVALCWEDQSKKSLEPETARFLASMCEKMERDFTTKYGQRP
jgi:thiamine biosynthesis protein ThiC